MDSRLIAYERWTRDEVGFCLFIPGVSLALWSEDGAPYDAVADAVVSVLARTLSG